MPDCDEVRRVKSERCTPVNGRPLSHKKKNYLQFQFARCIERTQETTCHMGKCGKGRGGENNTWDEGEYIMLWGPLLSAVHAELIGAVVWSPHVPVLLYKY